MENLGAVVDAIQRCEKHDILFTPEVTNCISFSRSYMQRALQNEERNDFLNTIVEAATEKGIWVALGSLAVKTKDADGRFANRGFLINPEVGIVGKYDKLHMFDVKISETEAYHESRGYRPGQQLSVFETDHGSIGFTICYDLRFPYVFNDLAIAGAKVISVPSAFAVETGLAHWESLLRSRAIETGCFIVAAAQTGTHTPSKRKTNGHSLIVNPWGDVILDAGEEAGLFHLDLDLALVDKARSMIPTLANQKSFRSAKEES